MVDKVRWGILGPGKIAHKFAKGLAVVDQAELVAVGSRSLQRANEFANQYQIPRRYGNYQDLIHDKDIDIIYIATPHPFHYEQTLLCLDAGKAVLCEKPIAIKSQQLEQMIKRSREKQVFLMEAMWTRFLPTIAKVRQWLAEDRIGQVRMVKADFGFRIGWNPTSRLLDLDLAGGGLLDVGVYTISLAQMIYGSAPTRVKGLAHIGDSGVDEQAGITLGYKDGQLAILTCAVRTKIPHNADILGTEGSIHIPSFWKAQSATLRVGDKVVDHIDQPFRSNGYEYEALEAIRCLRAGKLESEIMSHDESLEILQIVDTLQAQWYR